MTKGKTPVRILVADDHAIFRDGLRKLFDGTDEVSIVGEASDGNECVRMLTKLKPDILLLDLRMPDKDGLAVLQEVNFDSLPTRGIVQKQTASDLLVKSIRRVHSGEIWLNNRLTEEVMKAFADSSDIGARGD